MITREELIEIGQFKKAHGVKGEISASLDCDADDFTRFSCVVSDIDGIFVPFFVGGIRKKTADTVLLMIDGYESDEQVKALVNKPIFVLKREYSEISDEEDCDEMPVDYFIGFDATTSSGIDLGEIVYVDDSTDNVLFVIDHDGKEISIPAVDDFIDDINEDAKTITFDLPTGLLDI